MSRPLVAAALVLAVTWPVPAATAHDPARLVVVSPAEGERVSGDTVRVVVAGEGGTAAAAFRLDLDGSTVDATGRVGGVFSTLSVAPGSRLELTVPVAPGDHTLTATPNADADSEQVTVVRRFTVGGGSNGLWGGRGGAAVLLLVGAAAGIALVSLRRRAVGSARNS
ncbi:MAG TPA: hypothetical protein VNA20_02475 [Frankiaceae bacterium]|nr:hypothetical protein [Frankiaceae bacterium]